MAKTTLAKLTATGLSVSEIAFKKASTGFAKCAGYMIKEGSRVVFAKAVFSTFEC